MRRFAAIPGARLCLLTALLSITAALPAEAQVGGNRITLVGSWRITVVDGDDEEYTFVITTSLGERRVTIEQVVTAPLVIQDSDPAGWTLDVLSSSGIEEDDCLNASTPCFPAGVEAVRINDNLYTVWLEEEIEPGEPFDDVELRFERTGTAGGSGSPACHLVPTPTLPPGWQHYECGGRTITQSFNVSFGSLIEVFQLEGGTAVWLYTTRTSFSTEQAWFANDITSGNAIRQLTQQTSLHATLGGSFIETFQVHDRTAVWSIRDDDSTVYFANDITSGDTGSIRQITQRATLRFQGLGSIIETFRIVAGSAVWSIRDSGIATTSTAFFANDIVSGDHSTIRQITQQATLPSTGGGSFIETFFIRANHAVWSIRNDTMHSTAWYANEILSGSLSTIRQITQEVADPSGGSRRSISHLGTAGNVAYWQIHEVSLGGITIEGFANCLTTGTVSTIRSLTGPQQVVSSFSYRVVGNTAFWQTCDLFGCQDRSAPLPACGQRPLQPDAQIEAAPGGTATDNVFGQRAAVQVPAGAFPAATNVEIDVHTESPSFPPPPSFRLDGGTLFVDIEIEPQATFPLPPPGLTITLPLVNALPAGTPLALFVADPVTGHLVPKLNGAGEQIMGSVDSDGASATFHGIVSLSLFVGLRANSAPVAEAGPDQTVQCCGTPATLDGSASSDPDGQGLTFTWTGPFGTMDGAVVSAVLPLGSHTVTLTVDDGHGGTSSDSLVITVRDAFAALVEAVGALPDAALHKPELRSWLLGDLGGVSRTIAAGDLARAAFKLQSAIRLEIGSWVKDYTPSAPPELSKSQLLVLCDEAVADLLARQ